MKRILSIALAICAVLISTTLLKAEDGAEHQSHGQHADTTKTGHHHEEGDIDKETVEGEIIDITCYIRHDSKGPKHIKCAESCALLGMPFGVLEDKTNKIYLLLPAGHDNPIEPFKAHLGKKVKVKGLFFTTGGMTGLEIETIEEI
jgi:hypothetical protein